MKISNIKNTFRIPKENCFYIKEFKTPNGDEYLTKVDVKDTRLDEYEPRQIYYIFDSHPKFVLEFNNDTYKEIITILGR